MDTFPNFNMYAILENNIVINVGFGLNTNELFDYSSKPILNSGKYEYVKMTPENSPAELGMKYNGKTFSY